MKKSAITIADIANATGVSKATVSLALNNNHLVKDETMEKVRLAAKKLGYVPNTSARRLVRGKSGMLGVVVPDIENVYYASLVKEFSDRVSDVGYSLSIFISSNDPAKEERAIGDMIASRVEGIIYVPTNAAGESSALTMIQHSGIPAVCATTRTDGMNCVLCDLEDGMRRLMERLITDRPQRMVYLDGAAGVYALDCRRKAFLEATSLPGLNTEVMHLPAVDYLSAQRAIEKLDRLPDVIVCVNDFMALGVVNLLTGRGISVPRDVSVTGFDDSVFSISSPVPLTTVKQDIGTLAEKTVDLLLRMMSSETSAEREVIYIPTEVIVRKSTK